MPDWLGRGAVPFLLCVNTIRQDVIPKAKHGNQHTNQNLKIFPHFRIYEITNGAASRTLDMQCGKPGRGIVRKKVSEDGLDDGFPHATAHTNEDKDQDEPPPSSICADVIRHRHKHGEIDEPTHDPQGHGYRVAEVGDERGHKDRQESSAGRRDGSQVANLIRPNGVSHEHATHVEAVEGGIQTKGGVQQEHQLHLAVVKTKRNET